MSLGVLFSELSVGFVFSVQQLGSFDRYSLGIDWARTWNRMNSSVFVVWRGGLAVLPVLNDISE